MTDRACFQTRASPRLAALAAALVLAAFTGGLTSGCAKRSAETRSPDSGGAAEASKDVEMAASEPDRAVDEEDAGEEEALERQDGLQQLAGEAGDDLGQLADYENKLRQREDGMRRAGVWLAHLDGARPTVQPQPAPEPFPGTKTSRPGKRPRADKKSVKAKKPSAGQPAPGATITIDQCHNICDLAAATCDLEQKICALASRHEDEPRYAQVCQRARSDCQVARKSCDGCSG